jgi:DNA-binding CsgD family transcriptional regulator
VGFDRGTQSGGPSALADGRRLTRREREVLALLAEGLSGAQIAQRLVLSPDTVRTHVRNAMATLGASTRSQAVAMALRNGEIGDHPATRTPVAKPSPRRTQNLAGERSAPLAGLLSRVVELWDMERGGIYLLDDDGLSLRRVALRGAPRGLPTTLALAEGPLGRAALERRTRVVADRGAGGARIAVPIVGDGHLIGMIGLVPRSSRPIGQSELLLINVLATRIGTVLAAGGDPAPPLRQATDRFRSSWIAASATR